MQNKMMIEDLIRRCGISMETSKVGSNPIVNGGQQIDHLHHYKCSLYRKNDQFDVYLSVQPETGKITLTDVMFMLTMDASGCDMLKGLDDYRDEWPAIFGGSDGNLKEIEDFWSEYQSRCKQIQQFKNFLGDSAYNELLYYFDGENPLNEVAEALSESLA